MPRDKREAPGLVAQHLAVNGFELAEIAKLMGMTPRNVERCLEYAEQLRPKLCKGSCVEAWCGDGAQLALCPYCARVYQLHAAALLSLHRPLP